jgi:hypothetical protein
MARAEVTGKKIERSDLSADLLWGADEIAAYIGRPRRLVYYWLQKKIIPGTKCGETWTSTKSRLHRHFNDDDK